MRGRAIDLTGQAFGKWKVLRRHDERSPRGAVSWVCKCECGTLGKIPTGNLRGGRSTQCKRCGTPEKNENATSRHPLYQTWSTRVKHDCVKSWNDFYTFVADVEPKEAKSLRKRNPSKPFGPQNFMWSDNLTNIEDEEFVCGIHKTRRQWAKSLGISKQRIYQLIAEWGSLEDALRERAKDAGLDLESLIKQGVDAMAERLTNYQFQNDRRKQKYPWKEWADGSVWRVKQGEDFTCSIKSFRTGLALHARNNGLALKTRVDFEDDDVLIFQFSQPEGE